MAPHLVHTSALVCVCVYKVQKHVDWVSFPHTIRVLASRLLMQSLFYIFKTYFINFIISFYNLLNPSFYCYIKLIKII